VGACWPLAWSGVAGTDAVIRDTVAALVYTYRGAVLDKNWGTPRT